MVDRVPLYEARRWEYTEFGWAAFLVLDWPRSQLEYFYPDMVAIDEIVYQVTQTQVGRRTDEGWEVQVWTRSDLDDIPATPRWFADRSGGAAA